MSDFQMGIFCIAGAVSTLLFGWLLVLLCRRVCTASSKVFKTVMWYTSLAILLLDPLYLSVLCGFFGGGDMNGIKLLFPEIAVRIVFAVIGVIHGIWKNILMAWNWCLQVASPTVLQDPCTMIGCCQSGSSVSGKLYPSSTASAVPISSRMAGSTHCKRKTFVRRQGKQISTIGQ